MAEEMAYGTRMTPSCAANDCRVVEGVAGDSCMARVEGLGEDNNHGVVVAAVRDSRRADLQAGPTDLGEVADNPTGEAH